MRILELITAARRLKYANWLRPGSHGCTAAGGGVRSREAERPESRPGAVVDSNGHQGREPTVCRCHVLGALLVSSCIFPMRKSLLPPSCKYVNLEKLSNT